MKRYFVTYAGIGENGGTCENCIAFTAKELNLNSCGVKADFERLAKAHGHLYGITNVKVECVEVDDYDIHLHN